MSFLEANNWSPQVHTVGEEVKNVKPGDRVSGFACVATCDVNQGAFQQYTLLYSHAVTKIPSTTSFNEGSVLPMAIATAGVGISLKMGIPWVLPLQAKRGFSS